MTAISKGRAQTLTPLKRHSEPRRFITFDIESKHDDTQRAGFTRPFMVGVYDGKNYTSFRNDPETNKLPWDQRCYSRGGCIDKFLRFAFGETEEGRFIPRFKDCDIYAHNMGGFDGLFLPSWLIRNHRAYSLKIMPVQGRIQMLEVWRHNPSRSRSSFNEQKEADKKDKKSSGTWRFLDSMRIMPSSLQQLAKSFGFQGKVQHDLHMHEDDPSWDEYLLGDVQQLWLVLEKFHSLIDQMGGEVGITAPSTAMKLLRKRYLREAEPIQRNLHFPDCPFFNDGEKATPTDEELKEIQKQKKRKSDGGCEGCAHAFFRSAYFGGRTEVYRREGYGWYYDINSSYPYSMKNMMPTGNMEVLGENEDFTKFVRSDSHVGFIRCTVEIPETAYLPPLPVQIDGKLKFPTGKFSGTWNWLELQVLRKIGGKIIHVEKSVWIRATRFLADFVDSLYAFRDKSAIDYDKGKDQTAKIMLNSTFGKFGMEHERSEMLIVKPGEEEPWGTRFPSESIPQWEKRDELQKKKAWPPPPRIKKTNAKDEQGNWRTIEVPFTSAIYEHDSPVRVKDTHVDAPYIIPQIAAHITASSRMLLWYYAMEIIEAGYSIFYSDTDSILTDYPDLPTSTLLGGIKKEYNGEKIYVFCYAPKMYYMRKETPFEGEHQKTGPEENYKRKCLQTCPGCLRDANGKLIPGQHAERDGIRTCEKTCPGCAQYKIMMKGFPSDLRTPETIALLKAGHTVKFTNQERLGAIAKKGFKNTPKMVEIKKSLRSEYDKRIMLEDGNTKPLYLDDVQYLSPRFQEVAVKKSFKIPLWLKEVLPEIPVHPRT